MNVAYEDTNNFPIKALVLGPKLSVNTLLWHRCFQFLEIQDFQFVSLEQFDPSFLKQTPSLILIEDSPVIDWNLTRQSLESLADLDASTRIVVTERNPSHSLMSYYHMGMDDVIQLPEKASVIWQRIEIRLEKKRQMMEQMRHLSLANINIDLESQQVFILTKNTKTEIHLTPIEFRLLLMLLREINTPVSREHLSQNVWGRSNPGDLRRIDSHISHLRKKLGGSFHRIRSVYGTGYALMAHLNDSIYEPDHTESALQWSVTKTQQLLPQGATY